VYDISVSVAACLRSGTRADVAWLVEATGLQVEDWGEAELLTPGGGRIGSLLGGALDGILVDHAGKGNRGRLLSTEIADIDALIAGLAHGGGARCVIAPAEQFPADLWDLLDRRSAVCLVCRLDGDEVQSIEVHTADSAPEEARRMLAEGRSASAVTGSEVITVLHPVPRLVVVGSTPVAHALGPLADSMGWRPQVVSDAASATGLIATLSPLDSVVVASHDLEIAGGALMAALDSRAGYIGSVGSRRMQENRADWLAYRGVTDLTRVHGPAGLDIGAETPGEIAVSILAEAIAQRADTPPREA
jgi:xanthine dehydrogenase accessory factor